MRGNSEFLGTAVFLFVALFMAPRASGVIFYATGDPTYNTTAPTGALTGSGWQWAGNWGGYIGTPIGPHHFLTAHHIGGSVGGPFIFGGVSYTTTAFFDDTASDLRIWEVNGTFPLWAPIYRTSDEVGRGLVAVGMGLGRGAAVIVNGNVAGWNWGSISGVMRWGQNTVVQASNGGPSIGQLLYSQFGASANPSQVGPRVTDGILAAPISSSPTDSDGNWPGIAFAVDGPFSTSGTGSNPFNAALFDARGLYLEVKCQSSNLAIDRRAACRLVLSGFYATRASARVGLIDSIVPARPRCRRLACSGQDLETALLAAVIAAIGAAGIRRVKPAGGVV